MTVLHGLEELRVRYAHPVVTIGNFDGVHKGHQALFAKVLERAAAISGTPLAAPCRATESNHVFSMNWNGPPAVELGLRISVPTRLSIHSTVRTMAGSAPLSADALNAPSMAETPEISSERSGTAGGCDILGIAMAGTSYRSVSAAPIHGGASRAASRTPGTGWTGNRISSHP